MSSKTLGLTSIVVPTYNAEKYLYNTLHSVKSQTYTNWECIIVIDGGLDSSEDIAVSFATLDSRFRVIRQENRGLAGARNTGIRESKGEFIFFLDADDLFYPNKLPHHVEHLHDNPEVGVSYSWSEFIDDNGYSLQLYQKPQTKDITPELILLRNPPSNGSCPVIRKEVFKNIEFSHPDYNYPCYFDEAFRRAEDIECWLRISLLTKWKFEGIPVVLTRYRINNSGLSADVQKQRDALNLVLDKTSYYASEFISKYRSLAQAYQTRYLSRRAVRNKDTKVAVSLINQAIALNPKILLQEPKRTLTTFLAAYLISFTPPSLYSFLERKAIQFIRN